MYLESSIVVRRSPHEVWAFLADPRNLILWDRSVARVEVTSSTPAGIGFRFDTLAPAAAGAGFRSSYEVTEYEPGDHVWVDLTNSRWFSQARWLVAIETAGEGTTVRIGIALRPRWQHFYMWPVLRFTTSAITRDLVDLKRAIESRRP
jgi:hypothetical protein